MPDNTFEFVDQCLTTTIMALAKLFVVLFTIPVIATMYEINIYAWLVVAALAVVAALLSYFLLAWYREGSRDDLICDETVRDGFRLFAVTIGAFGLLYAPIAIAITIAFFTGMLSGMVAKLVIVGLFAFVVWKADNVVSEWIENRWGSELPG